MTKAQKYNFKEKKYSEYQLPEHASMYEDDMEMIIACAECGKPLLYGNGFTSRKIHTHIGMGYSVCSGCYETERKEELKW